MGKVSSVSVFCGSADKVDAVYHDAARRLGLSLARAGLCMVYGGEKAGLLGVMSNACLEAGGRVRGIIPVSFMARGLENPAVTELVKVDSLLERKRALREGSDAYIVMPGGLGTLDEAVDVLAAKYGQEHGKPVILVNTGGFYAPLVATIGHMIATGFSPAWHAELYQLAETPEDAVAALAA